MERWPFQDWAGVDLGGGAVEAGDRHPGVVAGHRPDACLDLIVGQGDFFKRFGQPGETYQVSVSAAKRIDH